MNPNMDALKISYNSNPGQGQEHFHSQAKLEGAHSFFIKELSNCQGKGLEGLWVGWSHVTETQGHLGSSCCLAQYVGRVTKRDLPSRTFLGAALTEIYYPLHLEKPRGLLQGAIRYDLCFWVLATEMLTTEPH